MEGDKKAEQTDVTARIPEPVTQKRQEGCWERREGVGAPKTPFDGLEGCNGILERWRGTRAGRPEIDGSHSGKIWHLGDEADHPRGS